MIFRGGELYREKTVRLAQDKLYLSHFFSIDLLDGFDESNKVETKPTSTIFVNSNV